MPIEPERLRAVIDEDGWWFGWTNDRGIPRWIPLTVQQFLVRHWNRVVCHFAGHVPVGEVGVGRYCTHCQHCTENIVGKQCEWCVEMGWEKEAGQP